MQLQSFFCAIIATAAWHLLADEECAMIQVKKEGKDANHTAFWEDLVGDVKQQALACAEGFACGMIDGAAKQKIKNDFATAAANYGCLNEANKLGENASKGFAAASHHSRMLAYTPCAQKKMTKSQILCSSAYTKRQEAACKGLNDGTMAGFKKEATCQMNGPGIWPAQAKKLCGAKLSLSGALKACGFKNTTELDDVSKATQGLTQMSCNMAGGILFEKILKKRAEDKASKGETDDLMEEDEHEIEDESTLKNEEENGKMTQEEVTDEAEEQEEELDKEAKEDEAESEEDDPTEEAEE